MVMLAQGIHDWMLSLGDNTPLGWATTAGYFVAAFSCLRVGLTLRRPPVGAAGNTGPAASRGHAVAWLALAAVLFFLGLNKQLDLQLLLREVARDAAIAQGWMGDRRKVQFAFVLTLGLVASATAALVLVRGRRFLPRSPLLWTGLALVLGYAALRTAIIGHVDGMLGVPWRHHRSLRLVEFLGVVFVAVAALRAHWRSAPR